MIPTKLPNLKEIFVWIDLDDTIWDMTGNSEIVLRQLYACEPVINRIYGPAGMQAWLDNYHSVNHRLWELYDSGKIDRATLRTERFAQPLEMGGLDRQPALEASARLDTEYLARLGCCSALVPGASELVRRLKAADMPVGIVSNGFREVQYNKLASAGLDGVFYPIVLSDDAGINKPAKEFFDFALARAGADATHSIIIGDNARTDIAGALAAGWAFAIWLCPAGTADPDILKPYTGRYVKVENAAHAADYLGI